jgi:tRNA (guanine37-N1)-methyltransferase
MTFHTQILTLYPEMFPGPLAVSLAGRALAEGIWSCAAINIRNFATDKHHTVDDTPAGGGPGMVLKADVLAAAIDFAWGEMAKKITPLPFRGGAGGGESQQAPTSELVDSPHPNPVDLLVSSGERDWSTAEGEGLTNHPPLIALTPRGKPITQARIREIAAGPGVTLICGRFEGFDERIFAARDVEEISVGDIVLSGGEPAALMLLDACIRLLPNVMGAASSGDNESFENGLLEHPHYTRPAEWEGRMIPQVLRSGDHAKIAAWRKSQAEIDTRLRRPDLWERYSSARVSSPSGAQREKKD